ncbi:ATP-dependent nuclease [Sphingobacterium sp.]|uniref:ATP-dependent nuclease n=1 Tax=Sphingobacterium sp. TaxID=341027 RepID=UPI002FDAAB4B
MNLHEFRISNFRSVKDASLKFPHNCIILLGKNEAGKSNILKAIAALFNQYQVSNKDKRKRVDNEKIQDFFIRGIFRLDDSDYKRIIEKFQSKYKSFNLVKLKNREPIDYLKKNFQEIIIQIKIEDNSKPYYTYWTHDSPQLERDVYLTNNVFTLEPNGGSKIDIKTLFFNIITSIYLENPLTCHYWQYSEDYLLPNSVGIQDFIDAPQNHKALENIFSLCGRSDIRKEFEDAYSEDGDYSNLLDQISKKVTSTFQKIWKDFKGTSIQLLPNGDELLIKVVDKAKYNFEDRSDGFKKFISILLMLSTQSRANKYKNDIILIDEPDQSLYPTSATHLRDELLEISKIAKVVYSTHSQYMIDPLTLDRHFVVEKKDDISTITNQHSNSPFTTDELLKRAIGSSIFECLQPTNIIFEGYLDKTLFEKYLIFSKNGKRFSNFGKVFLSGISSVETLVQILILANKKFIIVADSDETSNNKRLDFNKNYPEYKDNWIAYGDLFPEISTMEDFFNVAFFQDQIEKSGYNHNYNSQKNAIQNIDIFVGKDKELKQQFKNTLITNINKDSLNEKYPEFIDILSDKLKQ